jgi:hypothetical protein
MLTGIFGRKREEVAGGWRKFHIKELHNLCSSPNRMIKSRRLRFAGRVARIGNVISAYKLPVGEPE